MFGLGKKKQAADAPEADVKPAKASKSGGIDAKAFLLNHGEKFVVALFLAAAGYLIWSGTQTTSIDTALRNPPDLVTQASTTLSRVNEPHWEAIAPARKKEVNFVALSARSRQRTDPAPYNTEEWDPVPRNKGGKRSDPVLLAPIAVKTDAFIGSIAVKERGTSPLSGLPDAGPIEDRRSRRRGDESASQSQRSAADGYDFGYQPSKSTAAATPAAGRGRGAAETTVPRVVTFASITAAVPHQALVDNYNEALEGAANYDKDRDSPNYLGFEVERADVTDVADLSKLDAAAWQPLPDATVEAYTKKVESWPGTADETAKEDYVVEKLTMSIPPILIADYSSLVDHPKIPQIAKVAATAAYGEASYGAGYGDSNPDYGAGYGTSGGYGDTVAVAPVDPELQPKALTPTDYKLLRIFDFDVTPGRRYVYRTRLILEDPNYPRAEALQPATSTMAPETVARVQELKDQDAERKKNFQGEKFRRSSRLLTDWSETSDPVLIPARNRVFAGIADKLLQTVQVKDKTVEIENRLSATVLYGEWDPKLATLIPVSNTAARGTVLGGGAATDPLDVIDPIDKVVKEVPAGYKFSTAMIVTDIQGGEELAASRREDKLVAETKIAAFNEATGELVVTREFEDYVPYRLYSFADEREKIAKEAKEAAK